MHVLINIWNSQKGVTITKGGSKKTEDVYNIWCNSVDTQNHEQKWMRAQGSSIILVWNRVGNKKVK